MTNLVATHSNGTVLHVMPVNPDGSTLPEVAEMLSSNPPSEPAASSLKLRMDASSRTVEAIVMGESAFPVTESTVLVRDATGSLWPADIDDLHAKGYEVAAATAGPSE